MPTSPKPARRLPTRIAGLLLAGLLPALAPAAAPAKCSRVLEVPVAPIGMAVTVGEGERVGGIYPDLLRSAAARDGCWINFPVVPRARQEMMFETGQADLLLPARRSARRDKLGQFVPMIQSRAMLVSLPSERAGVHSLAELLKRSELRVVVVRGYDYDAAYQAALKTLEVQGRLLWAPNPISLARMLEGAIADLAIITPTVLNGSLRGDPKLQPLLARLRYEAVDELAWGDSGVYISSRAELGADDRALLREWLQKMGRSGAAWREFQRHYPDERLSESLRPR
ncbi:hypothetical protein [Roseateles violae]|uniref:Solute-binding protein family 3/N-terminal domain-containing protein n=1 Tax=Roseateles violae TaxID=3058042 RepID=A0ABT8DSP3_9BURK|nr:hypothetical protein [Pelomonas sp. PFR6]MDN3919319.1 hypothetical protein [Pelomonas sp. PFR6]